MCASACPSKALRLQGHPVTSESLAEELAEDLMFFESSGGGVTLSGGEPLMQPQFTADLLKRLGERGIHTALDTSLYAPASVLAQVAPFTRLLLVDIKVMDDQVHRRYTGVSNLQIIRNIREMDRQNRPMEFRIPCIPDCNMDQMEKIAAFLRTLEHPYSVKLLPYHDFGNAKALALGKRQPCFRPPTAEEMEQAVSLFRSNGIQAAGGGRD